MDTATNPPDEIQRFRHELFLSSTKTKFQKTYSHRGKSSRTLALPPLKPKRGEFSISKPRPVYVAGPKIWETTAASSPFTNEKAVGGRNEAVAGEHGISGHGAAPIENLDRVESSYDLVFNDHGTFLTPDLATNQSLYLTEAVPLLPSPSRSPGVNLDTDGNRDCEANEDNEDDDDLMVYSKLPLGYNPKHDRRTGNGTRSLRKRPFLIFNRTEARGYKQLRDSPQGERTLPPLRSHPGDGFSGREVRLNGSNLLTRSGRQALINPHVGPLDLVQSKEELVKQKRRAHRVTFEDNSFVSVPKKKLRRPLAPKDVNKQPEAARQAETRPTSGLMAKDTATAVEKLVDKSGQLNKGQENVPAKAKHAKNTTQTEDTPLTQMRAEDQGEGRVRDNSVTKEQDQISYVSTAEKPQVNAVYNTEKPIKDNQQLRKDHATVMVERSDDSQSGCLVPLTYEGPTSVAIEVQNSDEIKVPESPLRQIQQGARARSATPTRLPLLDSSHLSMRGPAGLRRRASDQ